MPIDLGANSLLDKQAPTSKKPPYLIILSDGEKQNKRIFQRFISLDKPRAENGMIEVRGFFCDKEEDEIIKSFSDILTTTSKELYLEVMFPLTRIHHVRNLIFNAVKVVTPVQPGRI